MTELHPNLRHALRDLMIETELHGLCEIEAARLLVSAGWAKLRSRKSHPQAMEHFQLWLDEIAAHPEHLREDRE